MPPKADTPRIVVLKASRLYGDLIRSQVKSLWRTASVQVFQRGFDALDAIQASMPDLFITGVNIDDMDGLEHLEPFIERDLPILVVTSRKDARTFGLLRTIRYDGIYDASDEGSDDLHSAMTRVLDGQLYVSPSMIPHLKAPRNVTLDTLTEKEQMVLSVIGDGSDDQRAAGRLALSPYTVNTHRKAIMGKLGLHHKGDLMLYALKQGFVVITPNGVFHPGFQRRIQNLAVAKIGVAKTGSTPSASEHKGKADTNVGLLDSGARPKADSNGISVRVIS